ncbi:MAG: hypothetical protein GOU99_00665 [Candidatus Altiarchaeota archaeon]|nr:hypothetical protein [Candidatus Altiarchaeota archaeon]
MNWKIPPKLKILEALGAIADNRVKIIDSENAEVISEDKTERFLVTRDLASNAIMSNDQESSEKGFLGYPSLAVLMINGVLPYDIQLAKKLKNVPWKRLRDTYKDYDVEFHELVKGWSSQDQKRLFQYVRWISSMLGELGLEKLDDKDATLSEFIGKG